MALLVTAYYPLEENFHHCGNKSWEHRCEHFLRFASLNVSVLVFTDKRHAALLRSILKQQKRSNVEVDHTTFPDFRTTSTTSRLLKQYEGMPLPLHRHVEKDTKEYMILQLCKTEFVAAALSMERYREKQILAWFDFSLGRLISATTDVLLQRLEDRFRSCIPGKICIAGCWQQPPQATEESFFQSICWRFCGGFFCGHRDAIASFSETVLHRLPLFMETGGTFAWEVNVWAWMETHHRPDLFQWYPGDHNDSIL